MSSSAQPIHGALDYAELASLGLQAEEIIDFSVNANPYGPSPRAWEAVARVAIDRYPDRSCLELRRAILAYELPETNLTLDSLVCGNGTAELIWTIAHACLKPGSKAAIIGPTFGEYRAASLAVGAITCEYRVPTSAHFQPDTGEIAAWIEREHPALVWLCNPNNPTGTWLDRSSLLLLAEVCRNGAAVLVIDEAYHRFVFPQEAFSASELIDVMPGLALVVLRSLTKDFALAGLRLGYLVTSSALARRLSLHLPSWNVNGAAQAAGIAALADRAHLTATLNALQDERAAFFLALRQSRMTPVPSRTHFCLLQVHNAHDVRQRLLAQKILVRDCTSFGLPRYIRVATRPMTDWQKLFVALQEVA